MFNLNHEYNQDTVDRTLNIISGLFPGITRRMETVAGTITTAITEDARGQYREVSFNFGDREKNEAGHPIHYDVRIWREEDGNRSVHIMWPEGKGGNWQTLIYDLKPDNTLVLRKVNLRDSAGFREYVEKRSGQEEYAQDDYFSGIEFDDKGNNPALVRRKKGTQAVIPEKTVTIDLQEIAGFLQKYDILARIDAKLESAKIGALSFYKDKDRYLNTKYFELSSDQVKDVGSMLEDYENPRGVLSRLQSVCGELKALSVEAKVNYQVAAGR